MTTERDENLARVRAMLGIMDDFLSTYKAAGDVVPQVVQMRATAQWELDLLENLPSSVSDYPQTNMGLAFQRGQDFIANAIPPVTTYDFRLTASATAISASGATEAYDYLLGIEQSGLPEAIEYAGKYTSDFRDLQTSVKRESQVRALLERLGGGSTLARFDRASRIAASAGIGAAEPTAAAMEIRTFMDGLKGDLENLARQPREQKVSPQQIAERLAVGGPQGAEYEELLRQWDARSRLMTRLTNVGKDRVPGDGAAIRDTWAEVLEHIYVVLTLTSLGD